MRHKYTTSIRTTSSIKNSRSISRFKSTKGGTLYTDNMAVIKYISRVLCTITRSTSDPTSVHPARGEGGGKKYKQNASKRNVGEIPSNENDVQGRIFLQSSNRLSFFFIFIFTILFSLD